jgi:uncharacterized membrane protein
MLISRYFIYFIIYGFFGWIYETLFCTIKAAKWDNRGFLFGPILPIYGVGGAILTVLSDMLSGGLAVYDYTWWQVFLVSFFGSIVLEYVTSWALEKMFHAYWWDYSNMPLNINGRVCLPYSLCFGAAGLLIVYIIAPFIKDITAWISPVGYEFSALVFMSVMSMDIAFTVSALTDFENSVMSMEEALNAQMDSFVEAAIDKAPKNLLMSMNNATRAAIRRIKGFTKSKKVDLIHMENVLAEIKTRLKL